jgi:hypothetical protein
VKAKIKRSLCLNEQSVPFIPHIQKNSIFASLLAHNRKNEYHVVQEYITFDFETIMKKETHKITDKKESYAQQLPLSIAYYVNNACEKTTRFLYRGVTSNETFINIWLNMLFNNAQQIFERQVAYYDSLNLPEYILNKFDINIFVNHITDSAIHIKSVIGIETQYKSLTLTHNNYPFQIQFLDLKSFLAEGDLDKYATKFAKIPEKQKGVFPYEFLDTQNYVSELNKQELFQHQDFK